MNSRQNATNPHRDEDYFKTTEPNPSQMGGAPLSSTVKRYNGAASWKSCNAVQGLGLVL